MVGKSKQNYTKNAYQLFLDDFRNGLNEKERSDARKVIKDGAFAWSELKNDAINKKNQSSIKKLNGYKEEAKNLKLTKNDEEKDEEDNQDYHYYVDPNDFNNNDHFDSKLDEKLDKQILYMIAHPGAESTPYD
jgi:hypothetical protein